MCEAILYTPGKTSLQLNITKRPSHTRWDRRTAQQRLFEFPTYKVMICNKNGEKISVGAACHSARDSWNNPSRISLIYRLATSEEHGAGSCSGCYCCYF